ncbi:MAG TPA: ABC transporter transmembrane domain-containing protein, partial [Verrucomicrobiae bacterium]|nr:ABC transporter transmembrane domain-containing protein [Verrucomicrobiae bacterium]
MGEASTDARASAPGDIADSALASFVLMLGFLQKPADPEQLRHAAGKGGAPLDTEDLLRLARQVEVRARAVSAPVARLARQPLPAIAISTDGRYFLLLQASHDKALIFHPDADKPEAVSIEDFGALYAGRLILMTTRDRVIGAQRAFDVTWFIPSLVKYRHLLRDVLIASFFIQILALISPIFFQIVIDKVLVHNGITTLEVLAIGFLCVSIFDVVMGGLRTYLFTHTTSRVDAELGSRLFSHLTRLPMSYFQARRVGDS